MSGSGKGFEQNAWYDLEVYYDVSDSTKQTDPIGRHKISGFPPLEDWEMGWGG